MIAENFRHFEEGGHSFSAKIILLILNNLIVIFSLVDRGSSCVLVS